jgi:hypothetical protein
MFPAFPQISNCALIDLCALLVPFQSLNPSQASLYVSTVLPSENVQEESITMEATAVMSSEGEHLPLMDKVGGHLLDSLIPVPSNFSRYL